MDDNSSFSSISLSSASLSGIQNPALNLYPSRTQSPNRQGKFWIIEEEDENLNNFDDLLDSNIQNRSFSSVPSHFISSSSSYHPQTGGGIASILNNNYNGNLSGIVMSSSTTNISASASSANRDYHSYCFGVDKTKNTIRQDFRGFSPIHFNHINSNVNTNAGLASILPSGSRSLTSTPIHNTPLNNKNPINVNAYRSLSPVRGQPTDKGGTHPYIIRNQEFGPSVHFSDKNIFNNKNGNPSGRSATPLNQPIPENQDLFNPFMKNTSNTPSTNARAKYKGDLHNHSKIPTSTQPSNNGANFSNIGVFYKSSSEKIPLNIKNYMLNIINNCMNEMHIDPKKKDTSDINSSNNNYSYINMSNLFQTVIDYLNDEIVNNLKLSFIYLFIYFYYIYKYFLF